MTLLFWAVNFIPVAIALALIEIRNDMGKGIWAKAGEWGKTAFVNPYWERKMGLPVPFLKYLSWYHGVMFLIIMPLLFLASMFVWSSALSYDICMDGAPWYKNLASFLLLFGAIWLGNSGLEDFFYFAIQSLTGWYEPHALRRVILKKDFAWFKDWLPPICGLNIPGHWVFCPMVAIVLLGIHHLIMR